MASFKIVISDPKTGKSYQREVKDPDAKKLIGMKIRDAVKGELFDLAGYEFLITGGSDFCGYPMRRDVMSSGRKKILSTFGVGIRTRTSGTKSRKTVCGNTIHAKITQINLKITKEGKQKLEEPEKKEGEEGKADKPAKAAKKGKG